MAEGRSTYRTTSSGHCRSARQRCSGDVRQASLRIKVTLTGRACRTSTCSPDGEFSSRVTLQKSLSLTRHPALRSLAIYGTSRIVRSTSSHSWSSMRSTSIKLSPLANLAAGAPPPLRLGAVPASCPSRPCLSPRRSMRLVTSASSST